jgi:uncharacterized protein YdiU (UPF0061 family)
MGAPAFDNSYARLPASFHALAPPEPAPQPKLVRLNTALAERLGLDAEWLSSDAGVAMLSGAQVPDTARPLAMAYAGHQFGSWVPQLGDGRATLLGEVVAPDGARFDLQLKGSGRTHYSRGGDGKAVLSAVLREYIVGEAMAALGVPTTRALAAVTTGEPVVRNAVEPGAVLARVARSHVRVGTFQYFHARGDREGVETLADYVIERHYPEAKAREQPYRTLWTRVATRQAELVAQWMSLGFIHGVMNTDNMQVAGETIDYGPCAFMDAFHPRMTFSSIDHYGRYAWGNQPSIAAWNLARLAETLLPLLAADEAEATSWAQAALEEFQDSAARALQRRFKSKLGLLGEATGHDELVEATWEVLSEGKADFTLFFRHLTQVAAGESDAAVRALFDAEDPAVRWLEAWRRQLAADGSPREERVAAMRAANPIFIPRNHRVELALQAANDGDLTPFERLVEVLAHPFDEQPEHAELEQAPLPHEVVTQTFCGT